MPGPGNAAHVARFPSASGVKAYSEYIKTQVERIMSKGMEQKKETKKKPGKTPLEKRAEKKEKKEQRDKR